MSKQKQTSKPNFGLKKRCRFCYEKISANATICSSCSRAQSNKPSLANWGAGTLIQVIISFIAILVSISLIVVSYLNLKEAKAERKSAEIAFKEAKAASATAEAASSTAEAASVETKAASESARAASVEAKDAVTSASNAIIESREAMQKLETFSKETQEFAEGILDYSVLMLFGPEMDKELTGILKGIERISRINQLYAFDLQCSLANDKNFLKKVDHDTQISKRIQSYVDEYLLKELVSFSCYELRSNYSPSVSTLLGELEAMKYLDGGLMLNIDISGEGALDTLEPAYDFIELMNSRSSEMAEAGSFSYYRKTAVDKFCTAISTNYELLFNATDALVIGFECTGFKGAQMFEHALNYPLYHLYVPLFIVWRPALIFVAAAMWFFPVMFLIANKKVSQTHV